MTYVIKQIKLYNVLLLDIPILKCINSTKKYC